MNWPRRVLNFIWLGPLVGSIIASLAAAATFSGSDSPSSWILVVIYGASGIVIGALAGLCAIWVVRERRPTNLTAAFSATRLGSTMGTGVGFFVLFFWQAPWSPTLAIWAFATVLAMIFAAATGFAGYRSTAGSPRAKLNVWITLSAIFGVILVVATAIVLGASSAAGSLVGLVGSLPPSDQLLILAKILAIGGIAAIAALVEIRGVSSEGRTIGVVKGSALAFGWIVVNTMWVARSVQSGATLLTGSARDGLIPSYVQIVTLAGWIALAVGLAITAIQLAQEHRRIIAPSGADEGSERAASQ